MTTIHRSVVYADINSNRPRDNSDILRYQVQWTKANFRIGERLGKGTFGEVYKCMDVSSRCTYAIKVLLKKHRTLAINREIMILDGLQGAPNIIKYFGAIKDFNRFEGPVLIFRYVNPVGYGHFAQNANTRSIQHYMFQLLRAIEACHSSGIMHRDIKPENILIDNAKQHLFLIDFGHADYYFPGKEYSIHVCTRYYKGPELLINFLQYDYSLDMWSFGCVLAELIFRCDAFFRGLSNEDQLTKIAQIMGSKALLEYVAFTGVELTQDMICRIGKFTRISFKSLIKRENRETAIPQALDLLRKLLVVNHQRRITANEAMNHPYFTFK